MKTIQAIRKGLTIAIIGMFAINIQTAKAQQIDVSFQVFYNELSPYGSWVDHPDFGYCWIPGPSVGFDFHPYVSNGYWTVTQYGNTWVSNYPWGWATFHYGRWYFDDFYGWIWVPDTEWAPAWVVWRSGGGYYGWAPLSPGLNFSLSINFYSNIPNRCWTFVPHRFFLHQSVGYYCAPRYETINIVNTTTYITNYHTHNNNHYFTGPSRDDISRSTRRTVHEHVIRDGDRPGNVHFDRNTITLYKPSNIHRGDNDKPDHAYNPKENNGNHYGWDRERGKGWKGNNPSNNNPGGGNDDNQSGRGNDDVRPDRGNNSNSNWSSPNRGSGNSSGNTMNWNRSSNSNSSWSRPNNSGQDINRGNMNRSDNTNGSFRRDVPNRSNNSGNQSRSMNVRPDARGNSNGNSSGQFNRSQGNSNYTPNRSGGSNRTISTPSRSNGSSNGNSGGSNGSPNSKGRK